MFDVNTWVYGKMSVDAGILAIIGDASHILNARPDVLTVFPLVIYSEQNQPDVEFVDDVPVGVESTIIVDVYVDNGSSSLLAQAVCDLFKTLRWACVFNSEIPDPVQNVRHRTLRFYRPLLASDLT
jgi:hypothetical protein